tara:strand:+ start:6647 stop:7333 length:687 start_codon:yes stop_codon:yes gene_type:complete
MSGVKGIATALAKAQLQMGKAKEKSSNPHFKSKYANLASVMDACMEALNSNGIAVIQPIETETENGLSVTTVFIHGESGESLHNHVPLVVSKNDMQGYGSAITYARRYGLMMMAGLATEDDDGNAAVVAKPKKISDDQILQIDDLVKETNTNEKKMLKVYGVSQLEELNTDQAKKCLGLLKTKLQKQIADQAHAEETVEKIETVYEAAQENPVIELKKQKGSADGTAD